MLSADRMEEFQSEEEEPWYDQQDLEQGKDGEHLAGCQGWRSGRMRGDKKRGQITGTGGRNICPQDSHWLGKGSASSCSGTSVEILAPLFQTILLAVES